MPQQIPIPSDWDGQSYALMFYCIPDSLQWRSIFKGQLQYLTRGRTWDANTGTITDTQQLVREVYETMSICELDQLILNVERIAIAVEKLAGIGSTNSKTLAEIRAELDSKNTIGELADIIEILDYLDNIFGVFNLNISLGDLVGLYTEWRFKQSVMNQLEDIALSQRAQAVAQGGVDFAGVYDTFADSVTSLLLPAGWQGKAAWLWLRLKPEEIGSWFTWIANITGLILGSIRDAIYSQNNDGILAELTGLVPALQEIKAAIGESATMSQICCVLEQFSDAPTGVIVPDDSSWDFADDPLQGPPDDNPDVTWVDAPNSGAFRCQSAHWLVDWLILFYGNSVWQEYPVTPPNAFTLIDMYRRVIFNIPPLGVTLTTISSLLGQTLSYLAGGSNISTLFQTINNCVANNYDDCLCALYEAETPDQALNSLVGVLLNNCSLTSTDLWSLRTFWALNNVGAILFYQNDIVDISGKSSDCSACSDLFECPDFTFNPIPEGSNAGNPGGVLLSGSMEGTSTTFTVQSRSGILAGVQGQYVLLNFPDRQGCYKINVNLTNYAINNGGLAAQYHNCSGGTSDIQRDVEAVVEANMQGLCIAPCGDLIIRGGAGNFNAQITVIAYVC